jgi:hypothetical protein
MFLLFLHYILVQKCICKNSFFVLLSCTIESGSRIHERTIFVEVSGYNLESSQTLGFSMDNLKHRERGVVFYQVFLLSLLQ